eukprot:TRINITY_DN5278_c1_g1_i1.p1 TRINITY_DN5278_c1_g1~~TRINITY_DN5278_c1_g1_i1.p1  ORF type:complete len:333 (-),score=103.38 TRINITY_DN5278_c1_g1_i1:283-1281(-)
MAAAPPPGPPPPEADSAPAPPSQPAEDSEEESEEDELDEEPPEFNWSVKGARSSVSAEAYGEWNQKRVFTPPVHPKTEEQRERLLVVLKKSFLFNTLDKAQVDIIVGALVERSVEAEQRLIKEGDDGDCMFIIESGVFHCLKKMGDEEVNVKTCGPGDFFGELALLYNCPRAASVQAAEVGVAWELDRNTFNHIVRDAAMERRQLHEDFLRSVPLLAPLGQYEKAQLADALTKEVVSAGTVVFCQGDAGNRFCLVEEGELVARKKVGESEEDVHTYTRGGYFGELALMRDEARAASIIAVTEATLLYIDSKTFKAVLGTLEEVLQKTAASYS